MGRRCDAHFVGPFRREDPMGRLHDRMDRELRIRGYAENTRKCYIEKMKCFVR